MSASEMESSNDVYAMRTLAMVRNHRSKIRKFIANFRIARKQYNMRVVIFAV